MAHTSTTRLGVTTAVAHPVAPWAWYGLALGAASLGATAMLARHHLPVQVRLSVGHQVPAATALALLSCLAAVAALAGRAHERVGLVGLGAVSLAASLAWVLLNTHPYEGPVLLSFADRHGLHQGDLVAVVPAVVGLGLVALAYRRGWSGRPFTAAARHRRHRHH